MTTATSTRTVTINAAFLQEIKEVNCELWALVAKCSEYAYPIEEGWRSWMEHINALRELRDKLAMHFALEEAFGYFEDPICVSPQVAQRAANLRAEHTGLYVEICALVELGDELLYERQSEALADCLPLGFQRFFARLQQHEDCERELIQDAFGEDLGEGD